jgi:hypothetical protein
MAMSKAEMGLYAVGGLSIIGAFAFRNRVERQTFTNALIFGGGTIATAGVMSGYRVVKGQKQLTGFGLANTEETVNAYSGKRLKVWDDPTMGIRDRIFLLQGLVAKSVKDPEVRKLALAVTGHGKSTVNIAGDKVVVSGAGVEARDDVGEAKAIFDWVANPKNVRYTGDVGEHALTPGGRVEAVDQFQSALRTIEFKGGDCDDHAVLSAALAIQNGFPAKFRITSNTGDTWDHIYTMVGTPKLDPKKWIAMDTTLGPGKFNKQPKRAKQVDFAA